MLDPEVPDRRSAADGAADRRQPRAVDAFANVADNCKAAEVHAGRAVPSGLSIQAAAAPLENAVPRARAGDGHPIDDHVGIHAEGAAADPHRPAGSLSCTDGCLQGPRAVEPAGRIPAEPGQVERALRRWPRRRDLFEVGQVDHGPGRRVASVDLKAHARSRSQCSREQLPRFIEEMVRGPVGRAVGERISAVEPAVAGGQLQRCDALLADINSDDGIAAAARRRVRDRIADGHCVRRPCQGEFHELADAIQPDRAPPRSFRGNVGKPPGRANQRAVEARVLRFIFGEGNCRSAPMQLLHRDSRNRHRRRRCGS